MSKEKKDILIVEDEPSLRNALRDKLMHAGFNVLEAPNGAEGLKIALQSQPDVILLDILMPIMDGITMLKTLCNDDRGKNAKVIMLTNLSESEGVAEAMALGAIDYLIKSEWKLEDIVKRIQEALV